MPGGLYESPAEKLNPVKLLKIPNAQLRMALLSKVGPARLARRGTVVHREGAMRLFDIKVTNPCRAEWRGLLLPAFAGNARDCGTMIG